MGLSSGFQDSVDPLEGVHSIRGRHAASEEDGEEVRSTHAAIG